MNKAIFLYLHLVIGITGFMKDSAAQRNVTLHIVTDKNNKMMGFASFQFTINGQPFKLKAGDCMEKTFQADNIDIIVEDKRWVKQKTKDLHMAAETDMYIWILLKYNGSLKEPSYAAEVICKSCYEELREKCRKTIGE